MKNLTTRVPNYTQIYFPYSTVTSACQDSGLACNRTISIFRTQTYMQTRFRKQNKPFCIVIVMKYSKSIATKLFYQRTPRFMKSQNSKVHFVSMSEAFWT